jgi:hypothetical protein
MLRPLVTIAALWLLQLVAAAVDNPLIDLVPMPREVWDDEHAVAKRAEDYGSSVGLQTKEQLMWTSSESKCAFQSRYRTFTNMWPKKQPKSKQSSAW